LFLIYHVLGRPICGVLCVYFNVNYWLCMGFYHCYQSAECCKRSIKSLYVLTLQIDVYFTLLYLFAVLELT